MSVRRLQLVAGAGDPDPALALRVDVVAAAVKVAQAMDDRRGEKKKNDFLWQADIDDAVQELYKRTKRYMAACRERVKA